MEHFSFEPIFANSVSLVEIQLPMLRPLNESEKQKQDNNKPIKSSVAKRNR